MRQLCQIILKFKHKYRSYGPDKLNLWPLQVWPWPSTYLKKVFYMALLLLKYNNCAKLFWNPCINVEVMVRTNPDGRPHALTHTHTHTHIHRTKIATAMSCFTASGLDKKDTPRIPKRSDISKNLYTFAYMSASFKLWTVISWKVSVMSVTTGAALDAVTMFFSTKRGGENKSYCCFIWKCVHFTFTISLEVPSGHLVPKWRHIKVDATSSRRIDVNMTSFYCPLGRVVSNVLDIIKVSHLWKGVQKL